VAVLFYTIKLDRIVGADLSRTSPIHRPWCRFTHLYCIVNEYYRQYYASMQVAYQCHPERTLVILSVSEGSRSPSCHTLPKPGSSTLLVDYALWCSNHHYYLADEQDKPNHNADYIKAKKRKQTLHIFIITPLS